MISSLAPVQKFASPNLGGPRIENLGNEEDDISAPSNWERDGGEDLFWVRNGVCLGDDKAEMDEGGKKDSSESGIRLMVEGLPVDMVCAAAVSKPTLALQSEELLRVHGIVRVWTSDVE
jgi:hypothetical protein